MIAVVIFLIVAAETLLKHAYLSDAKRKKYLAIFSGTIIVLYIGLRHATIGTDTIGYIKKYYMYANYSFESIVNLYSSNLKDPTYYAVGWLFSKLFQNAQWWLAFTGAIYVSGVLCVVYRKSPNILLSILIFICLNYLEFSMTGLRQTVAMGITAFAFIPLEKRKPIAFILTVIIASLFHTSAIFFLIAYPIATQRIGIKHFVVAGIALFMFFFMQPYVRRFIAIFFSDNRLSGYANSTTALNFSGFIIQLTIFSSCMVCYPAVRARYRGADILYNLAFVGMILQLFSSMVAEIFRLSMYFSVYNIVLLPMALTTLKPRGKKLVYFAAVVIFLLYKFKDGMPTYLFFWQ